MANLDAAAIGQLALRLGLLNEGQLEEAREQIGSRNPDPDTLLLTLERKAHLTPWQSKKLREGDQHGYYLGGYRILYKIASGSFGRVFRADDPSSGRIVAIKVLRRRWTEKPQQVELFLREGRVGLTLKHPSIVEMLAVSHDPASDQYYMVMEFVEGGNLREILKVRKQLTPAETLRILDEAAAGLAYAYTRGVTHRDLKLSNLLMSTTQGVKLVDFGLARLFTTGNVDIEEGDKVDRTVDYAGLEKATGVKPGDIRSDIYFLGCVGYQLLTGRSPLELSRSRTARMQRSRFETVPSIRPEEVKEPGVVALIETMMSLDPQKRYQTPAQLQEAIQSLRRELGGEANGARSQTAAPAPQTLFIVETSTRLLNALRDGFKKLGYRVLVSADPQRAVDRFRMQPFDALIVDAATTHEEGRAAFLQIMVEARKRRSSCVGVLVLKESQAAWKDEIPPAENQSILVRPVTIKQLHEKLLEMKKA